MSSTVPKIHWEDFVAGSVAEFGPRLVTRQEIVAFAAEFDPQIFHLDEAAAARSHFGALCASGWHTAAMWLRLSADYRRRQREAQRARGEPAAAIGPSPGFRDLKWLKPVYAGDTITFATEVVETRPSRSRPGWGMMFSHNTGTNQTGELVLAFVATVFVQRRPD